MGASLLSEALPKPHDRLARRWRGLTMTPDERERLADALLCRRTLLEGTLLTLGGEVVPVGGVLSAHSLCEASLGASRPVRLSIGGSVAERGDVDSARKRVHAELDSIDRLLEAAIPPDPSVTLQQGDGRGKPHARVVHLQNRLNMLGHRVASDGRFGPVTTEAVKDFQAKAGMEPTGIVDEETSNALRHGRRVQVVPPVRVGEQPVQPVDAAKDAKGGASGQPDAAAKDAKPIPASKRVEALMRLLKGLEGLQESAYSAARAQEIHRKRAELREAQMELELLERSMSMGERKKINKDDFVFPEKAPGPGSYPIHDKKHAVKAVQLSGGKSDHGAVVRKVKRRYPDVNVEEALLEAGMGVTACPTCGGPMRSGKVCQRGHRLKGATAKLGAPTKFKRSGPLSEAQTPALREDWSSYDAKRHGGYVPFNKGDKVEGKYFEHSISGTVLSHRHDTMNHARRHVHLQLDEPITHNGSKRERVYFDSLNNEGKDPKSGHFLRPRTELREDWAEWDEAHKGEQIPRKKWKHSGGRFVVGQHRPGGTFDIYRGANSLEGAKKAKREVSHWPNAVIYDQAHDRHIDGLGREVDKNGKMLLKESAKTPALSVTHAPIGKGGKNWITKTEPGNTGQLPAYIQNIRNAIMRGGKSESEATSIAIGRVKDWASGQGGVHPEVRAAAAKAVAEWEALRGKSHAQKAVKRAGKAAVQESHISTLDPDADGDIDVAGKGKGGDTDEDDEKVREADSKADYPEYLACPSCGAQALREASVCPRGHRLADARVLMHALIRARRFDRDLELLLRECPELRETWAQYDAMRHTAGWGKHVKDGPMPGKPVLSPGRGPSGKLRNFDAMSGQKLAHTLNALAVHGEDPEAHHAAMYAAGKKLGMKIHVPQQQEHKPEDALHETLCECGAPVRGDVCQRGHRLEEMWSPQAREAAAAARKAKRGSVG